MNLIEKELLRDCMRRTRQCRVGVGGYCMQPAIREGATVTVISVCPDELKCGDIIAYFVKDNLFVHRMIEKGDHFLKLCGDSVYSKVHRIQSADLFGKVVEIRNPSVFQRIRRRIVNYGKRWI
jgi:hypothetical protein